MITWKMLKVYFRVKWWTDFVSCTCPGPEEPRLVNTVSLEWTSVEVGMKSVGQWPCGGHVGSLSVKS